MGTVVGISINMDEEIKYSVGLYKKVEYSLPPELLNEQNIFKTKSQAQKAVERLSKK